MVLERSTSPASCRALAPAVATAMASSHMRMRFQSPMLTTSDTAPMVQKCVLLPTAPKRKASAKAPHTTAEASAAGLDSVKRPRFGLAPQSQAGRRLFLLHEALLGRDGGLVIAHRVVRVADPVLRRGQELAAREIGHEILEAGDGELIVAELELVERQLVRLFFRGGAALALAQD